MIHFIHSGDLGDVVYSLPVVRAYGGGIIHLVDIPGLAAHGMAEERAASLIPLLAIQPYITGVKFHHRQPFDQRDLCESSTDQVIDLNQFRFIGGSACRENLADRHLRAFCRPNTERNKPWLTINNDILANFGSTPVIIARSLRYHNSRFPWDRVMFEYGDFARFIGTEEEHSAFISEFGSIEYLPTPTLLDAAKAISRSLLFAGNQSCPLAIAHGLGVRVLMEVYPISPDTIFNRKGEFLGYSKNCILPRILDEDVLDLLPGSVQAVRAIEEQFWGKRLD